MKNRRVAILFLASVLCGNAEMRAHTPTVGITRVPSGVFVTVQGKTRAQPAFEGVMSGASVVVMSSDSSSPVGTWKTIDDKTGKTLSVVRVYQQDGKLFARIERAFTPGDEVRTCAKCTGGRKDQPLIGLVFMRNMKFVDGEYRDGDILDPDNGVIYRCKFRLEGDGTKLKVRGFVGAFLFGRSQTWEREQ